MREEGCQVRHITVDALDHLAGSTLVVKRHIEAQAVQGQILAQRVGRLPRHPLPDVGGKRAEDLLHEGHPDEQQSAGQQCIQGDIDVTGAVDEAAHDLGTHQLHADAAEQQHGQRHHPAQVRTQVFAQQNPILAQQNGILDQCHNVDITHCYL